MRAAFIRSFGGPDVFEIRDVDKPKPMMSEVLIRAKAIGVNPVETKVRSGKYKIVEPPAILGWDISGVIEELVPGVNRFAVGDEVFGMPFFPRPAHAYAEYVIAPSRQLALKPPSLGHAQAAALALAGLTAWQALHDVAKVSSGQRVLVHAAPGGVGHLAVQIAKALGAEVIATASGKNRDFVKSFGADEVIDYQKTDFAKVARDIDVVLESVGKDYGTRSIDVLKPNGMLITLVERQNAELKAKTENAGRRFVPLTVEPDGHGLERLAALTVEGKLRVHVSHEIPLTEIARAHELSETGGVIGKIVLIP